MLRKIYIRDNEQKNKQLHYNKLNVQLDIYKMIT